jgi:hypothetical protein
VECIREEIKGFIMGRKCKLTPEIQKEIERVLRSGHTITVACGFNNISRQTFFQWMSKPGKKYNDFRDTMEKALAHSQAGYVEIVKKGAEKDPGLAKWMLERRWPKEFAPVQRIEAEHTGKDGGPIEIDHAIDIFAQIDKYRSVFESNGSREEGDSCGNSIRESLDTT